MKKTHPNESESPSALIDAKIQARDDRRGKTLAHVRTHIRQAGPEMSEGWKWSVPCWSRDGPICAG